MYRGAFFVSGGICLLSVLAVRSVSATPVLDATRDAVRAYEAGLATPTFARQTQLACSACHTQFLDLTALGRQFKLNGYNMRGIAAIEAKGPEGETNLLINLVAPISVMVQTSLTSLKQAVPGTQNGTVLFPDQLSLFTGGTIAPKMGGFLQVTFDADAGTFGIDNADFRFATRGSLLGKPATLGLDLNNSPTVQDAWNSTPAWGFPFASSGVAPTPAAATVVDGGLAQAVAGLSGYTLWNNRVYAELGMYRSSPMGVSHPLDASATGVLRGVAPYWRVALPWQSGSSSLMIGTYGLGASVFASGVDGPRIRFTDLAVDAQYQRAFGANSVSAHATLIHERQLWDTAAGLSANTRNTLNTFRVDAIYHLGLHYGFALAPFVTTGSADPVLYAPDPVDGSRVGKPDSRGIIGEVDVNPWQNMRLQLQYVAYQKFNGATTDYDGFGRSASANNTLYFVAWLLY
jgi:hypothetical protein